MTLSKSNSATGAITLAITALVLAGCNATNQDIGRVTGAVAGGVLGNQIGSGFGRVAATIAGALADGLIGDSVGRRLDQTSRRAALQAEYNALERGAPGQPVRWQGTNGTYGQVVPQQTYQVGSQNCRRYSHTIYVDGTPQQASGTACRNPDGTWTPLS